MSVLSDPAIVEMVDEAVRAYSFAPANDPKLTNPDEVRKAVRGLKVGKAPGPVGTSKRALKHLPWRVISFLVMVFNAILIIQYLPSEWKHAQVISILKRGRTQLYPCTIDP